MFGHRETMSTRPDVTEAKAPQPESPSAPGAGPSARKGRVADRALEDILGSLGAGRRSKPPVWIFPAIAAAAAAAALLFWILAKPPPPSQYQVQDLTRGDLVASVSATGTLAPLNQVEVGSELSGTVERVMVDDNDVVVPGQVLARLDSSRLQDQIAAGEAAVSVAQAHLREAQATVRETGLRRDR